MSNTPANAQEAAESKNSIDVSVIIPVYNCARYLHETIGSVRAQGFPSGSYEIVAVDDGSTDESLKILQDLAKGNNDLKVHSIPNSGSAAAPRNVGLDHSTGRYVFFLDADDKFEPEVLPRVLATADNTGSGVVLCKMELFGEANRAGQVPAAAFSRTRLAVDFLDAKASSTLGSWKLFRRSVLAEHNIRFPLGYTIGEDQPFTMKAYLQSPHVSIMADRVYYWLRGRGDGTNVTSTGQPPRKHLMRIMTLIETIVENTEPGERRDQLLRRPIIGSAGITSVFGKKLLSAHNREEREMMLSSFRPLVSPLWTSNIRKHGNLESQLLVDLAIRNDLDEIERISAQMREKKPIQLTFDEAESQLVYVPKTGEPLNDLNIGLYTDLEKLSISGTSIRLAGRVGINGLGTSPESARLIYRHRKLGKEFSSELDVSQQSTGSYGARARFTASTDIAELEHVSVWDIFVEASWGDTSLRQRLGGSRSKSVDTSPTRILSFYSAVVFFSKSGGIAVDIGPTEKHAVVSDSEEPRSVGRYSVGRSEAVVISGTVQDIASVEAVPLSGRRAKPARLIVHSDSTATVIVARSVAQKGNYSIRYTDARGKTIHLPNSEPHASVE